MSRVLRWPDDEDLIRWECSYNRIIFTNGCFDLVHPGHLAVLSTCVERAEAIHGMVVVGVNSDLSVGRLKGPGRPVTSEEHRAKLLSMLRGVALVVIFDDETPANLLEVVKPVRVVKGGDYTPEQVISGGAVVEIVPTVEGHSSTSLIEYLRKQ